MTKKLLIIGFISLSFLTTSVSAFAQKIGAKAGVNIARISIAGNGESIEMMKDNIAFLTAPTYGLYLNFKLIPLLSLQIEGNLDPRGNKFDSKYVEYLFQNLETKRTNSVTFDGEMSNKLNYITVPIMLKAKLAFFHVEAGPYVGFLLNAKEITKGSLTIDGLTVTKDEEIDTKAAYKSTDIGIAAGAGLTFNLGPAQLMAGARYMMGMTDIVKEPVDDASAKHQVFTVYAGVAIGL